MRLPKKPPPPAWQPPGSVCRSLPDFAAADAYPTRSPLLVVDYLIPLVRGKRFLEIGSRNGDILSCVSHYASEVSAIEMDRKHCHSLRARGLSVVCKRLEDVPAAEFPAADVIFWWPTLAVASNPSWLQLVSKQLRAQGRSATVVIGFDLLHWQAHVHIHVIVV